MLVVAGAACAPAPVELEWRIEATDPALRAESLLVAGEMYEEAQAPGKALAAYQETLVSTATPFDHFRDALATGDASAASRYPIAAQRGLRLFIGSGNCVLCHFGPRFTNGEFADIGAPFFVPGGVDSGRHGGLARLLRSPFSRVGRFSDAPSAAAVSTRHVSAQPRNFGEFRVPSLREVARTAPYLHNGSLATLADVVRHYSELDLDRLHVHGEQILRPLRLSAEQAVDLVTFLETLSSEATTPRRISNDAGAHCAVSVLHGNVE